MLGPSAEPTVVHPRVAVAVCTYCSTIWDSVGALVGVWECSPEHSYTPTKLHLYLLQSFRFHMYGEREYAVVCHSSRELGDFAGAQWRSQHHTAPASFVRSRPPPHSLSAYFRRQRRPPLHHHGQGLDSQRRGEAAPIRRVDAHSRRASGGEGEPFEVDPRPPEVCHDTLSVRDHPKYVTTPESQAFVQFRFCRYA